MKTPASAASAGLDLHHPPDFSLVLGGSLFQLLRRTHLADDALLVVRRRIMVIALFAWLPLLLLSALEGNLRGGSTGVPFLFDIEVHVRFLVTLPLLVLAELVVHQRMRPLLQQFVERNLTPENATARFEAAIVSAFRLRNSVLAELLPIAFVYGVGVPFIWRHFVALDTATWYATGSAGSSQLSLAGMWFGYVSLSIFQFLLCRWYFRLFIWALSLAGVAHRIAPASHPSGSPRRPEFHFRTDLSLHCPCRGAWRPARRQPRQPHFLPRGRTASVQG